MTGQHEQAVTGFTRDLSGSNIGRRIVLIGTRETLAGLAPQFAFAGGVARPVGAVVLGEGAGNGEMPALCGLPVFASMEEFEIEHLREPVSLAVVSLPTGATALRNRTATALREMGVASRRVTPLAELLTNEAENEDARPAAVDLTELIGRTPHGIDRRAVAKVLEGRRVLITGAGGSIGSELCRIAATFNPACIIMMERSENALFDIDRRLAKRFPNVPRKAVLHDIADADATLRQFVAHKPHAVFHAAAHKHVPLMEDHPAHAITNNLFGTRSVADAALAVGAERFVMISSDKAVNPTSVMGATKRLAEMYVQGLAESSANGRTSFSMVRFGNVLGSACSVLPIWESQIAEGGPVTVTDDRMTRYFMTIHEAASLVIQASVLECRDGKTPSIYVLDMGEPVRILDLAWRFVRMLGYRGRVGGRGLSMAGAEGDANLPEMEIALTGSRPGEKLHEELAYDAEALAVTPYPGIRALVASVSMRRDVAAMVTEMDAARRAQDKGVVLGAIRRHVPEMSSRALADNVDVAALTASDHTPNGQAEWRLRAA